MKKLENDSDNFRKEAVAKAKAGDKKKAANLLRRKKMVEDELVKLEGQSIILVKQMNMIESA